jgi:signal transduction histidine kinase
MLAVAASSALAVRTAGGNPSVHDIRAAAFNALPVAALLVDGDGYVTACNEAMVRLSGLGATTMAGRPWWQLLGPRDGVTTGLAWSGLKSGERHRFVLHGSDEDRPVDVQATALEPSGAALLLLEPGWTGYERRVTRADSLLLSVAHELRSPLQAFNLALAGLAERPALAQEAEEGRLVATLQSSAVHLQAMVENLLDAASIDACRFRVTLRVTDLATVVDEAVLVVAPLLAQHGQRILPDLPADALDVYADLQRLRQVLVNLLHNAIKHGPRRETIVVRAQRRGRWAVVEVVDRGASISPDEQDRLFERGFRGHAAQAVAGSGLGLTIAKAIVTAHGGEMGVRCDRGKGTTFWFTLCAV